VCSSDLHIVEVGDIILANQDIEHLSYTFKGLNCCFTDIEVCETEGCQGDQNEGNQPSDSVNDLSGHSHKVSGVGEAL
jgi:hypothetical protein